ncbi:type VI secretion system-associated FHA domain protein TagH [Aminobacter carboxidus]|uniref:Type VI secretion system-associated FHA domain protein TagH n=1 Tax=Aminobacter carboxidus TaxID=376165 RepID=A0ABR9GJZ0_9HYPH|nr:type VI secretion system-associated FHA domain protein TagH [Aminobacter carboxidus]MBE1204002.1 type VI secretion system-associated FHA domain protein TagH [Aminobacter carboxidus]
MSLLLTLEQGPRAQAVRQTRLDKGELVIGRSPDADWQIDDPDMFVSRAHCKITAGQDGYVVVDTSSSGLFIDDAGNALGSGNSVRLRHGMRLRLGDYVVAVELHPAEVQPQQPKSAPSRTSVPQPAPPASRGPVGLGGDDFFSLKTDEEPQRPRPADLPNPFEHPEPGAFRAYERAGGSERNSPAFDDPFSLDPVATPASNGHADGSPNGTAAFADPFGLASAETPPPKPKSEPVVTQSPSFNDGFDLPPIAQPPPVAEAKPREPVSAPAPAPAPAKSASPAPWDLPVRLPDAAPPPPMSLRAREQAAASSATPAAALPAPAPSDSALHAAFLRGLGLDESGPSNRDPVSEMEKFGREYRLMLEGLMQLLRKRAEEKGNARIEQTIVGSSEVNPLKFLPTVDDALATILAERSPGFLAGEPAIADAIRDLAHHHVRAWRGLQGALRHMIDRFDPVALEEELKSSSSIEKLLAGGRSAKLWDLYKKRHREIAVSAETRFMGEIGADFRNAYEEE